MVDAIADFINSSLQGLVDAVNSAIGDIPDFCPFAQAFDEIRTGPFLQYLGYINYFLPVSEIMAIGLAWLSAILIYYGASVFFRWYNLIS